MQWNPGETFTLTASVLNSGSSTSSKTTLRYYRSTISTFSTSVMEDPVIVIDGLGPSKTERVSHPLVAPSDPGLYYYRTCVAPASGESVTDNNCSTGVLVTVEATQQGSPDLVVEAPSVSKNEIQPGGRFTLFATVRNIGDARAGSAILQYYRSTDSSISAGSDTEVGSDTVNSLQPSQTDGESVGVSAPEAPGEYYYGACVVRVTGGESDTGNNCSSGRRVTVVQTTHTSPDLVVDSPSVSQNEVDAGGRFTLRTTVRNSGDGPAPAATLRYYRSADSTITTGDAEVETDRVRYLDPSETGDESERLTAPDDAGTYYYGACVDWVTDESDTNNNCSSGVQVTVTEALQNSPDLVVSVSIGDTELEPGETFAVTSWVSNSGLATSPATTLRIYRSTDSSISAGDTVIGVGNVRSLAPSETQGYDLRNQIAPSVAGTYYYGSCVESVSGESDTTNNCSSGVRVTVEQTRVKASFQKFYVIDVDLDEYGDHDRECKLQLGGEYRLADWNDLKEYYAAGGSIPELISGLNWKDENTTDVGMKYLKVSKDGNERWGGSRRHYFVSRHDHVRPGYFLVHDHIDNYHLSLGSWYWRGGEALCMPAASAGDAATDRAALVAFYNATGGANWGNNGNWLSNAPMGEWHGVITDSDGRVTNLDLYDNQLTGAIPAELGNLTKLELLSLYDNQLTGAIPAEVGDLSNLTELYLDRNQLTGEIPAELGSLTSLKGLSLYRNQLTGEIPAELGSLTSLRHLSLSGNQLTGEIPAELGNLTNLTHLWLFNNQLTGSIPAELGNLTKLELLSLYDNQLTGEIPAELGDLANLRWLHLNNNQLTGEIPAELGNLTNLIRLHLYSNQLTGEIPAELGSLTNLRWLLLSSNQLTGCIPEGLRNVATNDFSSLGLPFCMPSAGDAATDRAALVALYNATGGANWRNNGNWLSNAPMGEWHGVTTDSNGRVIELRLSDNSLRSGAIPAALGSLSNLTRLDLSLNRLTGEIPEELGNLSNLTYLSLWGNLLTGEIPEELGGLFNLVTLSLSRNHLGGEIPEELGNLSNLVTLSLSNGPFNGRFTGEIPEELGNLSNLTFLSLNSNLLTGEIPEELGNLSNLTFLRLNSNLLTGEIPEELGNLSNLTRLDFSSNQLTGEIPEELGNLSNLTILRISGNSLTGCIPAGLTEVATNDLASLNLPDCVPSIEVNPLQGQVGDTVTVVGSHFDKSTQVSAIAIGGTAALPSPAPTTAADGSFTVQVSVPQLDVGVHVLEVTVAGSTATTQFTVTP